MIKKSISYEDLDGNKKSEDFWFQITKAEFLEKAMVEGGEAYLEKLQRLADLTPEDMQNGGGREVMAIFKMLLREGVGRREGDLFIKSEEITSRFMFSGAYDAFFLELIDTPDMGSIFMRNMLPRDAHKAIDEALAARASQDGDTAPTSAEPTPESGQVSLSTPIQTTELGAAAPQPAETSKDEPEWLKEKREPTTKELLSMPKDEMALAFKLREQGMLTRADK